jgi:hypothetical protein
VELGPQGEKVAWRFPWAWQPAAPSRGAQDSLYFKSPLSIRVGIELLPLVALDQASHWCLPRFHDRQFRKKVSLQAQTEATLSTITMLLAMVSLGPKASPAP